MKLKKAALIVISFLLFISAGLCITAADYNMIPIPRVNGGYVVYRGTSIQAKMPDAYVDSDTDFRAVWVSPLVGDLGSYSTKSAYKTQILKLFEVMDYYNMNAIIFHMRIFNDALYKSILNPLSGYFKGVDFDDWDPIEWVIEECHKRAIEFHAWLNPYRVSNSGTSLPLEEYAKKFPSANIASKPNTLLKGTGGIILNPGEPEVRTFLVDSCMEIINKYDVDAIHFDDYFYISGIDDTTTRQKYNSYGLTVDDFRREQVDLFIEMLSRRIRTNNDRTGRFVQLGISPTGIYRNGGYFAGANYDSSGNLTSPLGSNTAGYSHYDAPLYSNTKLWIDMEWIDYIVPQSYWAMEHSVAGYPDVMDWWVKVVKHKNVNLYSGMGLYMAAENSNSSWSTNSREAANQIQYASQYPEVQGHVIFSYSQVKSAYESRSGRYFQNLENVKQEMWRLPAVLPELRTYEPVILPSVQNVSVSKTAAGYRLDFNDVPSAKQYVIYRSKGDLTYAPAEVIGILGALHGTISFIDEVDTGDNYNYGIKTLSKTNSLGKPTVVSTKNAPQGELLDLGELSDINVPEDAYFGTTVEIRWPSLFPLTGGKAEYKVYMSSDNVHWSSVTTKDNPVTVSGQMNLQKCPLNTEGGLAYFYIETFNRTGFSRTYFTFDVYNRLRYIKHFFVEGDIYAGNYIAFKWAGLGLEALTYTVQTSPDGYAWEDITTPDNPVGEDGTNYIQSFTLPKGYSNNYYRLLAENEDGKATSRVIRVEAYEYIGDFNITVLDGDYRDPVYAGQFDVVRIAWDNHVTGGEEVLYRTLVSYDLKYWINYKIHSSQNTLIKENLYSIQTIHPDFRYFTLYVQVEAITTSGRSYSPIIEIRVRMEELDVVRSLEYIVGAPKRYFNAADIFK